MAFFIYMGFLEIFMALTSFVILRRYSAKYKNIVLPVNWPLVGMFPEFFVPTLRLYDRIIEVLEACNCSFHYKGPWFLGADLLVTVDPANVHYVMSRNFHNFQKGPKFREILEFLGDSLLNLDHESSRDQRRLAQTVMNHDNFMRFSKLTNRDKLYNGLVPILDDLCARGHVVDLQDLLQRFTFDVISVLVCGFDPESLSGDLPDVPYAKAMNDAEEAVVYRLVLPAWMWKLARWVNVGSERKLLHAWTTIDRVIANYLSRKRQELAEKDRNNNNNNVDNFDILSWYMGLGFNNDKFLRDTILLFMTAGRDTTSTALTWFFWVISKNPDIKRKILEEIANTTITDTQTFSDNEKFVYLHAALCETLRLYPPIPFEMKYAVEPDTLPSGHRVDSKLPILLPIYAMGRMRSIWGEDCMEFKPERWITETGKIKREPSYKFFTFNAGPRTCLGKEVSFMQMKMVAAEMVRRYEVEVVEGHPAEPCLSMILHMKHGLMVKVSKRSPCSL